MRESIKLQMAFLAVFIVIGIFWAKTFVTGINRWVIADAILAYQMERIYDGKEFCVTQDDQEDFNDTLWRLWDWSYNRILDEDKYRTIKPYIGRNNWANFAGEYFGEGK